MANSNINHNRPLVRKVNDRCVGALGRIYYQWRDSNGRPRTAFRAEMAALVDGLPGVQFLGVCLQGFGFEWLDTTINAKRRTILSPRGGINTRMDFPADAPRPEPKYRWSVRVWNESILERVGDAERATGICAKCTAGGTRRCVSGTKAEVQAFIDAFNGKPVTVTA